MMHMVLVELRRFWHRRLARGLVGGVALAVVFYGLFTLAAYSAAPDRLLCIQEIWSSTDVLPLGCEDSVDGIDGFERQFVAADSSDPDLRAGASGVVSRASLGLLLIWVVLGASAVGAEFRDRTIETQLLWYPRRVRVLGARIAGVSAAVFLLHVALLILLIVVLWPTLLMHGSTAGGGGGFWWGLSMVIVRGGIVAGIVAAIGAAVAFIARYTAASALVLLGYAASSPLILDSAIPSFMHRDGLVNLLAFARGADVGRYVRGEESTELLVVFSHGSFGAAWYLIGYCVLIVALSAVVFTHRDI